MEINKIYNEDCFETMLNMVSDNIKCTNIITSPPYNSSRSVQSEKAFENGNRRYDVYIDTLSSEDYIKWSIDLFGFFDKILCENGTVLYNISYGNDVKLGNPSGFLYILLYNIINNTKFTIVDKICWKKRSAIPFGASSNKLTRIVEDVFVLCRKDCIQTFHMNKDLSKISNKNQKYYKSHNNFIETNNNDEVCPYNKATYSTNLVWELMDLYTPENGLVYDPFMGSGTTGLACRLRNIDFIGSEISKNQCEWAENRINKINILDSIKSDKFKKNKFYRLVASHSEK